MTKYRDVLYGRWVGLMLVFVLLGALLVPAGAIARMDVTIDMGYTEGDPIDGLGSSGGNDGGDDLGDTDLGVPQTGELVVVLPIIFVGPYVWNIENQYLSDFDWSAFGKMHNWRVK